MKNEHIQTVQNYRFKWEDLARGQAERKKIDGEKSLFLEPQISLYSALNTPDNIKRLQVQKVDEGLVAFAEVSDRINDMQREGILTADMKLSTDPMDQVAFIQEIYEHIHERRFIELTRKLGFNPIDTITALQLLAIGKLDAYMEQFEYLENIKIEVQDERKLLQAEPIALFQLAD